MHRIIVDHGLLVAALLAIVVGYVLLGVQRLSVGPFLLVVGYCVLFPLYLWQAFRRRAEVGAREDASAQSR
jgi:hypothetical protein